MDGEASPTGADSARRHRRAARPDPSRIGRALVGGRVDRLVRRRLPAMLRSCPLTRHRRPSPNFACQSRLPGTIAAPPRGSNAPAGLFTGTSRHARQPIVLAASRAYVARRFNRTARAHDDAQKLEGRAGALHRAGSAAVPRQGKPGKLEITPTKPLTTQRDLSLAYSPGVAVPVQAIAQNPATAYDYTNKGNLVAVVSNGTAILGLGNLGALAAKPVMEGKAALFKRFADIDAIDLLVDTPDVERSSTACAISAPRSAASTWRTSRRRTASSSRSKLKELLDIPVFHDDQHGTAIIAAAGLINALELTGRDMKSCKLVVNGAGAAGIACLELLCRWACPSENMMLCDTKGVIYQGRKEGMNQWKSAFAVKTKARTLADALEGADAFFGLSAAGAVTQDMVRSMAAKPIIFAMANPDPEITPEDVQAVRSDAIVATGRSDYPNQINNVLGFPFIFRGALDVQASTINEAMKIAAAKALAELARADVPDQVAAAFHGRRPTFGPDYIIPAPFDPRLIDACARRRRQGGDGNRRRAQADRRHGRLRRPAQRPARSGRRLAAIDLQRGAHSTQAHHLRRGRAAAVIRAATLFHAGLRPADPDRHRPTWCASSSAPSACRCAPSTS